MKKRLALFTILLTILSCLSSSRAEKVYTLASPDGQTTTQIAIGKVIQYSVQQDGMNVLSPSTISMTLSDGVILGVSSKLKKSKRYSKDDVIPSPFYKSKTVRDHYNAVQFSFSDNFSLEFRAYDDGIAYRFASSKQGQYKVVNELAEFNFPNDQLATLPYVYAPGSLEKQLSQAFENRYTRTKLSGVDKNRLAFLPLCVNGPNNTRVTITESDLRDYPGMYVTATQKARNLTGFFAPLRNEVREHAGYNNLQVLVDSRHDYIAEIDGARTFPWRAVIVTRNDVDLANTTMSFKLAAPNKIGDTSWIKPGKVAWDWWNNWNLEGVDFVAGINNETYKYYIDFASQNGIEYVILDEGWAVNKVYDLMQIVPEIDVKELVRYGKERNVDIILWAGYYAFDIAMEEVCKHYSEMGVKGFKVDFMNGDDQEMVNFNERCAQVCAKYKLLVDLHGTYKPAGLNRTYPNVLNFEGVHGLEQMKWQPDTVDQVTYDVTVPYLRMISGPMDYTQGAMRNAVKSLNTITNKIETQYYPSFSLPMSQGTRCHQLAEYVIFLSPLNMLCDTPTNYERNQTSTDFIAAIPTTWDESKTIKGVMGEYIVTARRKGDTWYIGGLNNWDTREITLNLQDITGKTGEVLLYRDGPNANNNGIDFVKESRMVDSILSITMAPGGGFVIVL